MYELIRYHARISEPTYGSLINVLLINYIVNRVDMKYAE